MTDPATGERGDGSPETDRSNRLDGRRSARSGVVIVAVLVVGVTVEQVALLRTIDPFAGAVGEIAFQLVTVSAPILVGVGASVAFWGGLGFDARLPSKRELGVAIAGVVAAYVVFVTYVAGVTSLAPEFAHFDGAGGGVVNPPSLGVALLSLVTFSVVTVAIEEAFFRGVVQERLRPALGAPGAVAAASLTFAWFHVWPLGALTPPFVGGGVYYAAMGAVFGTAYELTENLTVAFLVHALFNAGPFLVVVATFL